MSCQPSHSTSIYSTYVPQLYTYIRLLALLHCIHVVPDPPTGVSVNSTCNSISLTWSAPHYTGGVPLEGYAVRWRERGSPLTTDGPDVTAAVIVTDLLPNTPYTITVTSVNAIGEDERSKQMQFKVITSPQGWYRKSILHSVHK